MNELLKINVNDHTEKKNGLTYLSWAWAWAEVLKLDANATWEAVEYNGVPVMLLPDGSAMVKVAVTIKGHTKTCVLPVMNHRNQAIKQPDAFAINTAIVRCMVKAIACFGLGLYIYAGEDLPEGDAEPEQPKVDTKSINDYSRRVMTAIEADNVQAVRELLAEVKAAGQEHAAALWSTFPTAVKNFIRDNAKDQA
jgi:hypothetical protein